MTTIIAVKSENRVYMGCDSLFMDMGSFEPVKRTQSKLIIKDELIIGMAGSSGCKMFQVIKSKLHLSTTKKIKSEDLLDYMVNEFCDKYYEVMKAERLLVLDEDTKELDASPAIMLIGIRDRIFHVGEDFDVSEIDMPFYSIGSGSSYALGSLNATLSLCQKELSVEDSVLFALKASEKFVQSVKGPFQLVNTGGDLYLLTCS